MDKKRNEQIKQTFRERIKEINKLQIINEEKKLKIRQEKNRLKLIKEKEEEEKEKIKLQIRHEKKKLKLQNKLQNLKIPYFIEAFTAFKGIKYNPKKTITKVLIDYMNHNQSNYEDKNIVKLVGEYLEFIRYRGSIMFSKNDLVIVELYLKDITRDSQLIAAMAKTEDELAIKVIESYEFFRICPGDAFGFLLVLEAYNSWVESLKK